MNRGVKDAVKDAAVRAATVAAYVRCSEQNDAGSQCVYGDGHRIDSHLFADGSRS